jgi:branched-chain amino acid transport system permease protein
MTIAEAAVSDARLEPPGPGLSRYTDLLIIPMFLAAAAGGVAVWANGYWIVTLTSATAIALAASGTALLYGQLGLVSLCQYSLLGIGGWVALRLSFAFALPFEINLLAAGVASSVIGMLCGVPALRLRGLYLALVTLMLAGGFQVVIGAWGFPDGGAGFFGRADASQRLLMARPAIAVSNGAYFLYSAAVLAFGLLVSEFHRRTKPGRAWALIRAGETTALSAGVNVLFYKAWAFALAGFFAGVAGALLAGGVGQLDGRAFPASESLNLFALTVVGGAGHWLGPVITGLLLRAVASLFTDYGIDGNIAIACFGLALLHSLVVAPSGLAGQVISLLERFGRRGKGGA